MHNSAAVQISLLCAEAAGDAATAEQDHYEGEHHDADDDANKLANAENQREVKNHLEKQTQIERGYKSCLYSRSLNTGVFDTDVRSETGFEMNQRIEKSYDVLPILA